MSKDCASGWCEDANGLKEARTDESCDTINSLTSGKDILIDDEVGIATGIDAARYHQSCENVDWRVTS